MFKKHEQDVIPVFEHRANKGNFTTILTPGGVNLLDNHNKQRLGRHFILRLLGH